ncbi:MAG: DNA gyrase C-terminal beta-propeller domain-containing protein, partial [Arcobacteraceae bacterium]
VGNVIVDEQQDLMLLTSVGKMIRVDMQSIRKAGRNTSGVIIVNVDKDDKVVSIAKCPKEDEELDIEGIEIPENSTTPMMVDVQESLILDDEDNE